MKKSKQNGWIVDSERIGKPLAYKKKPATITKVLNFKTVILDTNFERVFSEFSGKSNKTNYSTDELKDNSLSSLFGLAKKFTKSDRIQVEHIQLFDAQITKVFEYMQVKKFTCSKLVRECSDFDKAVFDKSHILSTHKLLGPGHFNKFMQRYPFTGLYNARFHYCKKVLRDTWFDQKFIESFKRSTIGCARTQRVDGKRLVMDTRCFYNISRNVDPEKMNYSRKNIEDSRRYIEGKKSYSLENTGSSSTDKFHAINGYDPPTAKRQPTYAVGFLGEWIVREEFSSVINVELCKVGKTGFRITLDVKNKTSHVFRNKCNRLVINTKRIVSVEDPMLNCKQFVRIYGNNDKQVYSDVEKKSKVKNELPRWHYVNRFYSNSNANMEDSFKIKEKRIIRDSKNKRRDILWKREFCSNPNNETGTFNL